MVKGKRQWHNDKRWGGEYDYYSKKNLSKMIKSNICGVCIGKPKDRQLHHIFYYADGGLSEPENLCWLCAKCHKELHRQDNNLRKKIKYRKELQRLKEKGLI